MALAAEKRFSLALGYKGNANNAFVLVFLIAETRRMNAEARRKTLCSISNGGAEDQTPRQTLLRVAVVVCRS